MRSVLVRHAGLVPLLVLPIAASCGFEDLDPAAALTNIPEHPLQHNGLPYCDDAHGWDSPLPHAPNRMCDDEPVACEPLDTPRKIGQLTATARCLPFLAGPVDELSPGSVDRCRPARLCGSGLADADLYPFRATIGAAGWAQKARVGDVGRDRILFSGRFCKPKFVVIHVANNPRTRGTSCGPVVNSARKIHFGVEPEAAFQFMRADHKGGHLPVDFEECHYVGVEHCARPGDALEPYYEQSAKLVGWLCHRYGLEGCGRDVVFGHRNAHPYMKKGAVYPGEVTSKGPMRLKVNNPQECPFGWDYTNYYRMVASEYEKWESGGYYGQPHATRLARND